MPRAYYNEFDPFAAQWLRNLIDAGLVAPGDVDERSIVDVRPSDLAGYTQVHLFAGIGVWSYALRLAGWPDSRPVWTASCPCQPFSSAGKARGTDDERHLWPHAFWLIEHCRPVEIYGEQVASKDGLAWLDLIQADLEGARYAGEANDLCAAGVGAPHIRQRLYWYGRRLDDGHHPGLEGLGGGPVGAAGQRQGEVRPAAQAGGAGGLAHDERRGRTGGHGGPAQPQAGLAGTDGLEGRLADEHGDGRPEARQRVAQAGGDGVERDGAAVGVGHAGGQSGQRDTRGVRGAQAQGAGPGRADGGVGDGHPDAGDADRPGPTNGRWAAVDWLWCRDEKWRPVEPGVSPLADRAANHVGVLRAYGNAIVSELAVAYIQATQEGGES